MNKKTYTQKKLLEIERVFHDSYVERLDSLTVQNLKRLDLSFIKAVVGSKYSKN